VVTPRRHGEAVVEQDGVKALDCNRYALEKKAGLSVVSWNGRDLAARLRKESDKMTRSRGQASLLQSA